jgi:hypothetical protein
MACGGKELMHQPSWRRHRLLRRVRGCRSAAPTGRHHLSDTFDTAPLGIDQTSLPGGWLVTGGTIDVIARPADPQPGHGTTSTCRLVGETGGCRRSRSLSRANTSSSSIGRAILGNHGALGVQVEPHGASTDGRSFTPVASDTPFFARGGHGHLNRGRSC